ncbi:hypothetical protein JCM19233_6389 [Vibrio astriarenae]|nr:hypothetical protein JCM19233_6389 [Vibrio sp. C7]
MANRPLTEGLIVTIKISLWSLLFAIVIGLFVGLMRISSNIAFVNSRLLTLS